MTTPIITLKINVTLIEKARLFKGEKGTYLDLVLIPTPNNQYGDYMIKQSVKKEERDIKMPILGNAKIMAQAKPKPEADAPAEEEPDEQDSVPF